MAGPPSQTEYLDTPIPGVAESVSWKILLGHEVKYDNELERLLSFTSPVPWPHKLPIGFTFRDFSRLGFYYTGERDIIKCQFCKQLGFDWSRKTLTRANLWELHSLLNCRCPLAIGLETRNIPIPDHYMEEDEEAVDYLMVEEEDSGYYYHPEAIYKKICRQELGLRHMDFQPHGENPIQLVSTQGIRKEFVSVANRLNSFLKDPMAGQKKPGENLEGEDGNQELRWDESLLPPVRSLANSGFFLDEESQLVCFHCNGILFGAPNWSRDTDAYIQHKQSYPGCLLSRLPRLDKEAEAQQLASLIQIQAVIDGQGQGQGQGQGAGAIVQTQEEAASSSSSSSSAPSTSKSKGPVMIFDKEGQKIEYKLFKNVFSPPPPPSLDSSRLSDPPIPCKTCDRKRAEWIVPECGHFAACDDCVVNLYFCPECRGHAPYIVHILEAAKL